MGFNEKSSNWCNYHDNGVIAISLKDNSVGLYSSISSYSGGWGLNMGSIRIKYVHQMQNLYYILTNKELKIQS